MRSAIIILLTLLAATSHGQQRQSTATSGKKPFVLGLVDELPSKLLSEKRTLNIYLPEGYNDNDTTTYPVVYLLDGSADEDFIHISGLYQFNSFPWVNRVAKSIVVGIANVDRKRDFTFPTTIKADKDKYPTTGQSGKFIAFLQQELQPYIRQNYRTNGVKTIIGESLGGLLATEILLKKPSLFEHYIIVSPSLWWDNGSLLKANTELSAPGGMAKKMVYIGVGKEGLTPGDSPRVMEVDANLLAEKLTTLKNPSLKVYLDYLPLENHGTIMHQAVFNALKLFAPKAEE